MNLEQKVKEIKKQTFEMVMNAGKGHLGGSFSSVECLVSLYYEVLKIVPENPKWEDRDYFILSKGHAHNCLYVILADLGFFPKEQLNLYCQNGGLLGGHSDEIVPGVEVTTGSLGHGLGLAAGIALGLKISKKNNKIYCIIGDGELQEGSIWEALMFISHHKLNNLITIIDRNRLGSEDLTEKTCSLNPLKEKLNAFNFNVEDIDGHHIPSCLSSLRYYGNSPRVIILNTIKGKGLYELEGTPKSHHTLPKGEQIEKTRENFERI